MRSYRDSSARLILPFFFPGTSNWPRCSSEVASSIAFSLAVIPILGRLLSLRSSSATRNCIVAVRTAISERLSEQREDGTNHGGVQRTHED